MHTPPYPKKQPVEPDKLLLNKLYGQAGTTGDKGRLPSSKTGDNQRKPLDDELSGPVVHMSIGISSGEQVTGLIGQALHIELCLKAS